MASAFVASLQEEPKKKSAFMESLSAEEPKKSVFLKSVEENAPVAAETPEVDAQGEAMRDPRRLLTHAANAAMPVRQQSPIAGAAADFPIAVAENLGMLPEGQGVAAYRLAGGAGGFGNYGRLGRTIKFAYPKLGGRNPTLDEIRGAAKNDENVGVVLDWVERMQAESKVLQAGQEVQAGGPIDWEGVSAKHFAVLEQSRAERKKAGDKTVQLGNQQQLIEEFNRNQIPGITRPAMTDQEVADSVTDIIRSVEAGDLEKLPTWAKTVAAGLASGAHIAATGPVAKLLPEAAGAATRGATQFGALSAEQQALAIASGAQPEFDYARFLQEVGVGAFSGFAASKMAERSLTKATNKIAGMDPKLVPPGALSKAKRTAEIVGNSSAIAAMETANSTIDAIRGHEEIHGEGDGFWASAWNKALGIASTIASAHALGAVIPGKPRTRQDSEIAALDAYTKPIEPAAALARSWAAKEAGVMDSPESYLAEQRAFDKIASEAAERGRVETYVKVASLGGRVPALGEIARRMFDNAPKQTQAIIDKNRNEMVHRSLDIDRLSREMNRFLDAKTGNDPTLRAQLQHVLWTEKEGAGEITSQFRSKFSKDTLAEGSDIMQRTKRAMLEFGIKGEEVGFFPVAIFKDAAGVETKVMARDIAEGRISPDSLKDGSLGELVGGIERFRQEGGYLPHIAQYAMSKLTKPWQFFSKGKPIGPATIDGHLSDEYVRQRTMRREKSTSEFVSSLTQAGKKLDTSYDSIVETAYREAAAIATKASLEDFKASGILRRGNQLPGNVEMETIRAQLIQAQNEIGARREEVRKLGKKDIVRKRELYHEIAALKEQEKAFKLSLSGEFGWTKMEGKEWGEYDSARDPDGPGWFLRTDAFSAVRPSTDRSAGMEMARSIHRLSKAVRTGFSPIRRALEDEASNLMAYADKGLFSPAEWWQAKKDNFRFRFGDKKVSDPTHEEFLAISRGHFIGSSSEMQQLDAAEFRRASSLLNKAMGEGRWGASIPLAINKAVTWLEKFYGEAPVLGTAAKAYKAFVDEADALAGYRVARKRGLSVEEAWEEVAPIADFSSLPPGVQRAGMAMSFIRYPAQMGRLYGKYIAERPATFYGINVGKLLGLDKTIRMGVGDKRAQTAFYTRSMLNLIAKASQVLLPITVARNVLLHEQGISEEEWDSYMEQQYRESASPIAGLQKLLALPAGRTELGRLSHLDLGRVIPWMAPLTFFKAHPDGGHLLEVMNKNTLLSPWGQALYNRDYRGTTPPPGSLPGERWWGVWSQFVPGMLTTIAQEVTANATLPERERSALRSIARLIGVPLKAGEAENKLRTAIDEFRDLGIVQMVEGEDGREFYGIAVPWGHPLAKTAATLIDMYYKLPVSEFQVERKAMGKVKRLEDAMQIR